MGRGKAEKPSSKNRTKIISTKRNSNSKVITKKPKQKKNEKKDKTKEGLENSPTYEDVSVSPSASQQLSFFLNEFESANGVTLSSLERESITDKCFLELGQDVKGLGSRLKVAFGPSWKEVLCEGQIVEGKIDAGNPAVLIVSSSALRSLELMRGVRLLTRECSAVKLFSKHMKVEEQIALLKNRVNFTSGTPSRVKKLIDIEALGLSRLTTVVLDIDPDVKGYTLLTLPQVRNEFWDLYNNYFHQRLVQGDLRICLFGLLPKGNESRSKRKRVSAD
uniref:Protein CMSS1 n=2 Tax=Rhizophora mucronata TaxID=61149 RepID=A0A2P2KJE4_RHIMU